jgi:cysteine-rich repeat protein
MPSCHPDCSGIDASGCFLCGNGRREAEEECDQLDFSADACEVVSDETGGPVLCTPDCRVDRSLRWRCGNGRVDPGEQCDDGGREPGDGCSPDCSLELGSPEEALSKPGARS